MNFKQFVESDEDYWTQRLQQFQAAQSGQKGAIADPRRSLAKYKPLARTATPQVEPPAEFERDSFGNMWEKPRKTDAFDLTTLNRSMNPASDGSYYYQDKQTRKWLIMRRHLSSFTR